MSIQNLDRDVRNKVLRVTKRHFLARSWIAAAALLANFQPSKKTLVKDGCRILRPKTQDFDDPSFLVRGLD
jgi:hypothetical protein